ncbi:MAG: hypothetical protein IPN29_17635 [Saprospiraceae bacterium]|nr:hypothetical protein [Saprospiraceae bacterium]
MRQHIGILLVVLYSMAAFPVGELAKLPFLIEHYGEHKAKDSEMGFVEFLSLHYSNCHVVFPDYDKDMKLPFKSANTSVFAIIGNIPPVTQIQICTFSEPVDALVCPLYYKDSSGLSGHVDVWQPPRLV